MILLQIPKCCFGIRCHKHTNHEGNSHDRRSNACRACVVNWLEVLLEVQLLVWRLQGIATPLVAWGRDDARSPNGQTKHQGLVSELFWCEEVLEEGTHQPSCPAVDDVTCHSGNIRLVQQGWLDLPVGVHALLEAVVGHWQHDRAEKETADGSTNAGRKSTECHGSVNDFEDREFQHVGWESGEEESGHQCQVHLTECLAHSHSLHQKSVDQGFTHGRQNCCHEGRCATLCCCRENLAEEIVALLWDWRRQR
mmetsp:Transcript_76556/g.169179  ORF Transcript_76556/g.169179 Transcript_76556/m.169179 type:complete len:252 (+) Transcript_76556:284-1039(+)